MRLLYLFGCLITLNYFDYGFCAGQCNCFVDHPQQSLCEADFAFVGTILSSEDDTDVFVYEVEISGDRVYKGLSYLGVGTEHITVYTPYGTSLCGRPNLLHQETYLITGGFLEGKFVITYCNWVVPWEEVPDKQRDYLQTKEYLNHCNLCKIYGVKNSIRVNQNDNELVYPAQVSGLWTPYNCFFNPVASATYRYDDCETMYSFCHPATEERCDWKLNPEYEECFISRESAWARYNQGAAAYTSVKDCKNLDTKRKKKRCLKKVKEYRASTTIETRDMLEELLDLRDMWLNDDVFDDEY